MPDDPPAPDPPAPTPAPPAPDEEGIRRLIREEIAAALEGSDPDPDPTPKATTAREREAIAEAAARKAVEAVKAAEPKPPKPDDKPPVIEPVKKGPFQRISEKMWGPWDEVAK